MTRRRRVKIAATADAAVVLLFVAIGRRSHDEGGNALTGALGVAAPFLIGLGLSWVFGRVWAKPFAWRSGVIVWVGTVIDGVLLRRFVFDRSTATGFIVVATISMGVLFNGWRAVARRRWRDSSSPAGE